ncbi:hypothetical protein GQ42DRAFT_165987, partial [Ramicandelaber brevisporus]
MRFQTVALIVAAGAALTSFVAAQDCSCATSDRLCQLQCLVPGATAEMAKQVDDCSAKCVEDAAKNKDVSNNPQDIAGCQQNCLTTT